MQLMCNHSKFKTLIFQFVELFNEVYLKSPSFKIASAGFYLCCNFQYKLSWL